jgi:hypothetical protein
MKTILAIMALSTSVGVTAYHVTEPDSAPSEMTASVDQQPELRQEAACRHALLRPPVPLNIVTVAQIESDESESVEQLESASNESESIANEPDWFEQTIVKWTRKLQPVASLQRSVAPAFEQPVMALKPARSRAELVVIPAKAASRPVAAIPVSAQRIEAVSVSEEAAPSASDPSRAMPMVRKYSKPRRTRANASREIERHLRPGPSQRP